MKREGFKYIEMADWDNIVRAENISTRRKKGYGVELQKRNFMSNLVEIQQNVLSHSLCTSGYKFMTRKSGQDKLRKIGMLDFHPNHIQHQLLVLVSEERIDKSLIRHTYASRKGYGQHMAALQVSKWIRSNTNLKWYLQEDIVKYYDNIEHSHIKSHLERLFKDDEFIECFLEPFEKYAKIGVPIGIRPSQISGNLVLSSLDRFIKETLHVKFYIRYLDDILMLFETEKEAKIAHKRIKRFINNLHFSIHEQKMKRISSMIDFLGYKFYKGGSMYWRTSDKKRWLKNRSRLTNKKRIKELDDAAFGMLKWGNKHCKKLYEMNTGVKLSDTGIKQEEEKDSRGVPFIDANKITTPIVLYKTIEVLRWVKNIKTSKGEGRYALLIVFCGEEYKLIVNSFRMKNFLNSMEDNNVTRFSTQIIDEGANRYRFDESKTVIMEIGHRKIEVSDGVVVFSDTKEEVGFKNK